MNWETVTEKFGNRLRVRICGILIEDNKLLLIKHKGLGTLGHFWAPPGGGMKYGLSALENLKREFIEETGLKIEVDDFLCIFEFTKPPLHAIELFFRVKSVGGTLIKGRDPELEENRQIIETVKFVSLKEINMIPGEALHGILHGLKNFEAIFEKKGYYKF